MLAKNWLVMILALSAGILFTSCTAAGTGQEEPSGNLAFVDLVNVEMQSEHHYAIVEGHYPDACSRISDVVQKANGMTIEIELYVDRPVDLMCAQMLTPFNVAILLEVGGLSPGEYEVKVHDRTDTLILGP